MQTTKQLRFQIQQLRQDKIIFAIESIAVIVFALFVSAFLPNLLLRYFYPQNLTEMPKTLEYIPVIAFVVGVGYFLFVAVTNLRRWDQVKRLEKQLADLEMNGGCSDCCGCDSCETSSMGTQAESVGLLAEKMKSAKKRKATKRS